MTVPCRVEELVAKPQDQDVLDHLLTQIVVDTEDLLLFPVGVQSLLEIPGALKILTERLLDLLKIDRAISNLLSRESLRGWELTMMRARPLLG